MGYDPEGRLLEVEFRSGEVYQYLGVPLDVYEGILHAPSPGTYFRENVKEPGYEFRHVA